MLGKEQVAAALGWDVGTEGRVTWTVSSERGPEVRLDGTETNEFLRLLRLGPLEFSSRFEVDEEGRIATQTHEVDWSGTSVADALAPVLEWAAEVAPDELAEIYPDGGLVYTEEMGRRWVKLLRDWRAATGERE